MSAPAPASPMGRAAIQALNDSVLCALAVAGYASAGVAQSLLRVAAAVLAGRALAAGVARAPGPRARTASAGAYVGVVWLATFSPIPLLGSPDVVRSGAAAAMFVLIVGNLPGRMTLALSAALATVAMLTAGAAPCAGPLGEAAYAVGASWPRDWGHVSLTASLFLFGSAWAASALRAGTRPTAT